MLWSSPYRLTIIWLLSIFKAAVVKPPAHCKCMGNFYSLITSLPLPQMKQFRSAFVWILKGFLANSANFILIDHYIGELLSINKVSSERERTIYIVLFNSVQVATHKVL